jgi:SagB-type dehydrogenase family enzyme
MNSIGKEFIEKTKYKYLVETDQVKGFPRPSLELEYDNSIPIIQLPKPPDIKLKDKHLRECIEKRRSIRDYSGKPLSLKELSYLLWCTQGVRELTPRYILRNVPSAGARHAFETYILVKKVEGLQKGVYRFIGSKHGLIAHNLEEDIAQKIKHASFDQDLFDPCAVVFIWAVVVYRMTWRYRERGYRYILLDAGHVCQNLYLAAESIDCGVCAIAAYDDDELNKVLGLDGVDQFVIYLAAAGKK